MKNDFTIAQSKSVNFDLFYMKHDAPTFETTFYQILTYCESTIFRYERVWGLLVLVFYDIIHQNTTVLWRCIVYSCLVGASLLLSITSRAKRTNPNLVGPLEMYYPHSVFILALESVKLCGAMTTTQSLFPTLMFWKQIFLTAHVLCLKSNPGKQ